MRQRASVACPNGRSGIDLRHGRRACAARLTLYTAALECGEALALLRRAHPELSGLAAATTDMLDAAKLPAPLDRRARHVVTEKSREWDRS